MKAAIPVLEDLVDLLKHEELEKHAENLSTITLIIKFAVFLSVSGLVTFWIWDMLSKLRKIISMTEDSLEKGY